MKKILVTALVLVCLFTYEDLTAQIKIIQNNSFLNSKDSVLLDVKVTNFLFKKTDFNNSIVEFTQDDVVFLNNYFAQKEGVLSLKSHLLDKSFEVVSLLQKEGKIIFQHRQVIEILQKMGYITIQMNCKREQRYLPVHQISSKELFPKA